MTVTPMCMREREVIMTQPESSNPEVRPGGDGSAENSDNPKMQDFGECQHFMAQINIKNKF